MFASRLPVAVFLHDAGGGATQFRSHSDGPRKHATAQPGCQKDIQDGPTTALDGPRTYGKAVSG